MIEAVVRMHYTADMKTAVIPQVDQMAARLGRRVRVPTEMHQAAQRVDLVRLFNVHAALDLHVRLRASERFK
jgi:hypothetical protein